MLADAEADTQRIGHFLGSMQASKWSYALFRDNIKRHEEAGEQRRKYEQRRVAAIVRQHSNQLEVTAPRFERLETERLADAAKISHGRMIYCWRYDQGSMVYEDRRAALITSLWTKAESEEAVGCADRDKRLATELDGIVLESASDALSLWADWRRHDEVLLH